MKRFICGLLSAVLLLSLLAGCAAGPGTGEDPGGDTPHQGQVWNGSEWVDGSSTGDLPTAAYLRVWGPYPYTVTTAGHGTGARPEATERVAVEPDVRCDVQWAEGLSEDEALERCIRDYITLALTLQAAPERSVEQPDCCTEEALRRLYFDAFMCSGALYLRQEAAVTVRELAYPAEDAARVRVEMVIREDSSDICDAVWRDSDTVSSSRELTLAKTASGWRVTEDSSSFAPGKFWSEGTVEIQPDILPERAVQRAVEAYLAMRADEMAGRLGDSGCTTSALLADAKGFAADLGLARVYDAQSRATLYAAVQDTSVGFLRLSVTEVMRIDALSAYGAGERPCVRSAFAVVDHVLTLCPTEDHYIVTGDLYKFGSHACSIVDYLD